MSYVGWALTMLAAGLGSSLGAYLKKKGENLATHEDIDKLVDQVRAVTTATRQIEAQISSDVWDRQKRWELRRDVLFETARKAAYATDALMRLHAVYMTEKAGKEKGQPERIEKKVEVSTAWNNAASELRGMALIVRSTCGPELVKTVLDFAAILNTISQKIMNENPEAFLAASGDVVGKSEALSLAIREELEIPRKP